MSASDNLSHQQLAMFMTAKDLRKMHLSDVQSHIWNRGGGLDYKKTAKAVMSRKVRESKKSGLYDSIKEKGVQEPVVIGETYVPGRTDVIEGHHRIASQMSIDPKGLIPVRYSELPKEK